MKRWIIYLLVLIGAHIYFISVMRNHNQRYWNWEKEKLKPTYVRPNWNYPKTNDIFLVKDTLGIVRYYKISETVKDGALTLQRGKYEFSTKKGWRMNTQDWNFEFLSDPLLYLEHFQKFTLDEFLLLKEDAFLTQGLQLLPSKDPRNAFLIEFRHYILLFTSLVVFFTLWLFGLLKRYLSAFSFYADEKLMGIFTILFMTLWWRDSNLLIYKNPYLTNSVVYAQGLLFVFILFYIIRYLNTRIIGMWRFSDQEAAKFMTILSVGALLSCLTAIFQYGVYDYFEINIFVGSIVISGGWKMYLGPFIGTFWLSVATGNFLNNFRKHFFQLRRKANAFRYAKKQELEFKSELETLQAKINPHFLYNSLNSIASLAQTDPAKTETMALALSKFYKEKTNRKENIWSTVAEELEMLKTYLAIEKIRFGDRLQVELYSTPAVNNQRLPRFLLQPLIENAIKFGYDSENNKISVKVKIELLDNYLSIRILDSGLAFSADLDTGYGIRSVQKKLKLFYAGHYEMEFINHPQKQVLIEIRL